MNKKVILIILDGFGASSCIEGNAVLAAKTPTLDFSWANYPKTLMRSSGEEVGLMWGEMGNSEVGHMNLGCGRVPQQDLPRINESIENGAFFNSKQLLEACDHVKKNDSKLHLMGLLSDGGVHAHYKHLIALMDLAKKEGIKKVVLHLILDGRDMPAKSAERVFENVEEKINEVNNAVLGTCIGRFYAMDRDNNWDRIKKAYDLILDGVGIRGNNFKDAIDIEYRNGIDDERMSAICFDPDSKLVDNDAIIFFNYRSDRAKQLSETFINNNFDKFDRNRLANNVKFVSFVSYGNEQTPLVDVAYPSSEMSGQLAQVLSDNGKTQFHIAETEKYAHVTYFFNGGRENEFNGESRIIVNSPNVDSYDKKPEMSAIEVCNRFIEYFKNNSPDFSIINFANADMVGHTGNMQATINAIECIDMQCKRILTECVDGSTSVIIASDHGNADQMINPKTKEIDKQHTTNAVPFVLIPFGERISVISSGISKDDKITYFAQEPSSVLADVSTTILDLLDVSVSDEMTGISIKDSI